MLASIIASAVVTISTMITEPWSWLCKWMEGFLVINDETGTQGVGESVTGKRTVWEDSELSTGCLAEKDLRKQERI